MGKERDSKAEFVVKETAAEHFPESRRRSWRSFTRTAEQMVTDWVAPNPETSPLPVLGSAWPPGPGSARGWSCQPLGPAPNPSRGHLG